MAEQLRGGENFQLSFFLFEASNVYIALHSQLRCRNGVDLVKCCVAVDAIPSRGASQRQSLITFCHVQQGKYLSLLESNMLIPLPQCSIVLLCFGIDNNKRKVYIENPNLTPQKHKEHLDEKVCCEAETKSSYTGNGIEI